jgi:hypothetical protein
VTTTRTQGQALIAAEALNHRVNCDRATSATWWGQSRRRPAASGGRHPQRRGGSWRLPPPSPARPPPRLRAARSPAGTCGNDGCESS